MSKKPGKQPTERIARSTREEAEADQSSGGDRVYLVQVTRESPIVFIRDTTGAMAIFHTVKQFGGCAIDVNTIESDPVKVKQALRTLPAISQVNITEQARKEARI